MHPDDERYAHLHGAKARLPIIGRELQIIFDEAIEKEFGTGALKVTPGHDQTDFEIGERHGLEIINVMNPDGTLNENGGPYAGMDRFEARKRDRRRPQGRRASLLRKSLPPLGRPLRPLRHRRRAADERAVVRRHDAAYEKNGTPALASPATR